MNEDIKINAKGCPVCGHPDITALDSYGCTTFDICPSCGCESGYAYGPIVSSKHLLKIRKTWLINEAGKWWSTIPLDKQPEHWSAIGQLLYASLPIPIEFKNMPKDIKREVKILTHLCRRLWNAFDPISVSSSGIQDEYDGYIPQTVKLILENGGNYKFMKHIEDVVCVNMGMENYPRKQMEEFSIRLAQITDNYN